MKFYNRKSELKLLADIDKYAESNTQLTVLVGRKRIGKTRLILKSFEKEIFL